MAEDQDASPEKPTSGRGDRSSGLGSNSKRDSSLGTPISGSGSRDGARRDSSLGSPQSSEKSGTGSNSKRDSVLGKDDYTPRKKGKSKDKEKEREKDKESGATSPKPHKKKEKEERKARDSKREPSKSKRKDSETEPTVSFCVTGLLPSIPSLPTLPPVPPTTDASVSSPKNAQRTPKESSSSEIGDAMKYLSAQVSSKPTLQRRSSRAGIPVTLARDSTSGSSLTAPKSDDSIAKALVQVKAVKAEPVKTPRALADWDKLDEYEQFMMEIEADLEVKRQTAIEDPLSPREAPVSGAEIAGPMSTERESDIDALLRECAIPILSAKDDKQQQRKATSITTAPPRDDAQRAATEPSAMQPMTRQSRGHSVVDDDASRRRSRSASSSARSLSPATRAVVNSANDQDDRDAIDREIDEIEAAEMSDDSDARASEIRAAPPRASQRTRKYSSSSSSSSRSSGEAREGGGQLQENEEEMRNQRFLNFRKNLSPVVSPRANPDQAQYDERDGENDHNQREDEVHNDTGSGYLSDLYKKLNQLEDLAGEKPHLGDVTGDEEVIESGEEFADEPLSPRQEVAPDDWEAFVAQMLERQEMEAAGKAAEDELVEEAIEHENEEFPRRNQSNDDDHYDDYDEDEVEPAKPQSQQYRQNNDSATTSSPSVQPKLPAVVETKKLQASTDDEWDSYMREVSVESADENLARAFDTRVSQVTQELLAVLQIAVKFAQSFDIEILKGLGVFLTGFLCFDLT
jgi:hypothetical protein